MRFIATLAAVPVLFAAVPAIAQDSVERAPFTGPHAEVLIGYESLQAGDDGNDIDADAVAYGVAGGFDFQVGQFIAGVEGEYGDSDTDFAAAVAGLPGGGYELDTDRDLYVGGRVGFAVAPSTLLYVKGGYTNLKLEGRFNDGAGTIYNDGSTLDGFRVGAGLEQKFAVFGPSGFLKVEYRYSNYSNLDVNFRDAQGDLIEGTDVDVDVDRHQVMAGFGIRF